MVTAYLNINVRHTCTCSTTEHPQTNYIVSGLSMTYYIKWLKLKYCFRFVRKYTSYSGPSFWFMVRGSNPEYWEANRN